MLVVLNNLFISLDNIFQLVYILYCPIIVDLFCCRRLLALLSCIVLCAKILFHFHFQMINLIILLQELGVSLSNIPLELVDLSLRIGWHVLLILKNTRLNRHQQRAFSELHVLFLNFRHPVFECLLLESQSIDDHVLSVYLLFQKVLLLLKLTLIYFLDALFRTRLVLLNLAEGTFHALHELGLFFSKFIDFGDLLVDLLA